MYHKKRTFKIFAVAAHPEALCKVTLSALHSFLILCGYIAEVHTGGEKAGGHAGKMDKNVFGDYAVALSPSFILGSSLSLSVSKKLPFTGLQLQIVNYLWQLLIWLFLLGQSDVQYH